MPKEKPKRADMLQGTLDLLILKSLSLGPMHGWGVERDEHITGPDRLYLNDGR